MMRHAFLIKFSAIIIFLFSITQLLFAQKPADTTAAKKQIIIIQAQRLNHQIIKDSAFQSLVGNVIVRQDKTMFYCDSAVIDQTANIMEAYGHVHINDNDSINTYADYLKYLGNDKKAFLNGNCKLTDGKGTLTTPSLEYDLNTKLGTYLNSGKLVENSTVLTSKEGYYYGETKDATFKKNVVLIDPQYTIKTDTLLYNTYSQVTTFVVPTEIISGPGRKILTSDGYYDTKNKKSYFGKRPTLIDSATTLIADEVANDDSTHFGEARGNVIYKDTSEGITILSNDLKTNKLTNAFLATEKPIMIIKQDKDSVFIAADTLYSAKLSDLRKSTNVPMILMDTFSRKYDSAYLSNFYIKQDSINKADSSRDRFFEAYFHVKIYSDSMQAVCDSMFYSAEDSAFRLFRKPIVWGQNSQITGDTIYLFTQDKKPKELYDFYDAFTVNDVGHGYYNQIKGRTINAYFKDGEIDYMHVKGTQAESIYYAQDDNNKFVGVNKATSDVIDMYFDERKPTRVVFRSNLKGTTYPMRQVSADELKLKGFQWLEDLRPKSEYDLFAQ